MSARNTRTHGSARIGEVAVLATAAMTALTVLSTTPASAEPAPPRPDVSKDRSGTGSVHQGWLADPEVVPNPRTARTRTFSRGTVQVRYGSHQGTQYGWGRALGANGNHWILFEVDLDGDRSWDIANGWRIGTRSYTRGYPASASPDRAFRACIVTDPTHECNGANGTAWW